MTTSSPIAGSSTRALSPIEYDVVDAVWKQWNGQPLPTSTERFIDLRFEKTYDVYRVRLKGCTVIAKKTSPGELAVYTTYLGECLPVPALLSHFIDGDDAWLLLEDLGGHDLQTCHADDARVAGHALGQLSAAHWQETPSPTDWSEEAHVHLRRQAFWALMWSEENDEVARAWRRCFFRFLHSPRGLVSGDCLPMNVVRSESASASSIGRTEESGTTAPTSGDSWPTQGKGPCMRCR